MHLTESAAFMLGTVKHGQTLEGHIVDKVLPTKQQMPRDFLNNTVTINRPHIGPLSDISVYLIVASFSLQPFAVTHAD